MVAAPAQDCLGARPEPPRRGSENATPTSTPPAPATSSPPPKSGIPPLYDLDAKWDACLDLAIHRIAYSSLVGALAGLLLFRKETRLPPHCA